MAYEFYVSIKGTKQGQFRSTAPSGRGAWKIKASSFKLQGSAGGGSMTVTSAVSPQLDVAKASGEMLTNVEFEFTRGSGPSNAYEWIKLTNAVVKDVRVAATAPGTIGLQQEVTFTYQHLASNIPEAALQTNLEGIAKFQQSLIKIF